MHHQKIEAEYSWGILGCNRVTRGPCLLTKQKTEETLSYEEQSL